MFRVSCIQLKSNNSIQSNFIKTEKLINKAIAQKTDFILTPEVSSLFTLDKKELLKQGKALYDSITELGTKWYVYYTDEFYCKYYFSIKNQMSSKSLINTNIVAAAILACYAMNQMNAPIVMKLVHFHGLMIFP